MVNSKKILILTAPFGSGHLQVSSSLTEEFLKHDNVIVEEYDLYSDHDPEIEASQKIGDNDAEQNTANGNGGGGGGVLHAQLIDQIRYQIPGSDSVHDTLLFVS